jgi:phosphoribosylglycinamide formyltransferase 1
VPIPIFQPNSERPMNIIVFGSGSGTVLEALIRAQKTMRQPNGCSLFEIKALFTDRQCRFQEIAERERIPLIFNSFIQFYKKAGIEDRNDLQTRIAFDQENVRLIENCAMQRGFEVDLIFLAGYMRLIQTPLLTKFKHKIVNVHPADLTIKDENGKRRYVGANAVYDALMAGEIKTRSSVILIDEDVDTGPILASGPWVPYNGDFPATFKRAAHHQERQKALSDWPTCVKAVKLIAQGRLSLDDNRQVYIEGIPQEEGGYIMERFEVTEFLECVNSSV